MYPYTNPSIISRGLSAIKAIKWGSILDGTQKTLGVINQAIPVIYQVKPIVSNAKTLFKIANVINTPEKNISQKTTSNEKNQSTKNSPVFYI